MYTSTSTYTCGSLPSHIPVWHVHVHCTHVDNCREVSDEEEDTRDLKATITQREKQGTRNDSYVVYKIVTEVGFALNICLYVPSHMRPLCSGIYLFLGDACYKFILFLFHIMLLLVHIAWYVHVCTCTSMYFYLPPFYFTSLSPSISFPCLCHCPPISVRPRVVATSMTSLTMRYAGGIEILSGCKGR